jgi:hypothetical protein
MVLVIGADGAEHERPGLQVPIVYVHVISPYMPMHEAEPRSRHGPQVALAMHCDPLDAVHPSDSGRISTEHEPPLHVPSVQLRVRNPVPMHVVSVKQGLQGPQLAALHVVPSVERVHAWVSIMLPVLHVPPAHTGVRTTRDCVPVSSHVLEKSPHGPHGSAVSAPQTIPSVARTHGSLSVRSEATHVPAAHV